MESNNNDINVTHPAKIIEFLKYKGNLILFHIPLYASKVNDFENSVGGYLTTSDSGLKDVRTIHTKGYTTIKAVKMRTNLTSNDANISFPCKTLKPFFTAEFPPTLPLLFSIKTST